MTARFGIAEGWRGLLLPAALLTAWALAGAAGIGNPALFVPVDAVARAGLETIASGELPAAIGATIARALFGWSIGALCGFAIGLLLGVSALGSRFASPVLHGARQVALFAWIPLLSAWLGNGEAMKLALIALSAFFPVFLNVEAGCRQVPLAFTEVGRLFGFNRASEIACIIFPAATPTIIAGLELAFAVAWIGTIGAEYLIGTGYMYASADGIGAFLSGARENARMDLVIVGILSLALTGFALDRAVVLASRKVLAWRLQSR
ncbi:MAG TPA: ABC transporter permease subunit [Xanthobacteraceae bacterium]|nr:ABC transporter permease subunit [Xanthobacteraceae bacterium]